MKPLPTEPRFWLKGWIAIVITLACLRFCFAGTLWSDEDYHMAAALQILHGKVPYRDFWYDKPPLNAVYYLAIGTLPGLLLRLWDAVYVLLCCFLAYRLASSWWTPREGRIAALLLAFFTAFYIPAAVIPFAPDALLVAPHLAAIYFARQGKPRWAGAFCGLGFWINVKVVFVLASCLLFAWPAWLELAAGFAMVLIAGTGALAGVRGLPAYWEQVWRWGLGYASGSPVAHPVLLGIERVSNWIGFHGVLALGAANSLRLMARSERIQMAGWILFSFAAVCLGNHFAPRYFLQVLVPLTIAGSRGLCLFLAHKPRLAIPIISVLALIPVVRFGPRYPILAREAILHIPSHWSDAAMDLDSQQAAAKLLALSHAGDSLFVWGYRPDLYVYTRMPTGSRFWDSQPLTGVPADRHLSAKAPLDNAWTRSHLQEVERDRPAFIVDGLGPLNPALSPPPELLKSYQRVDATRLCVIYRKTTSSSSE